MINHTLVTLVNSVLGTGKKTARGNMAYNCPHCNHHKPKLEINFTENKEGIILGIVGYVIRKVNQLAYYLDKQVPLLIKSAKQKH